MIWDWMIRRFGFSAIPNEPTREQIEAAGDLESAISAESGVLTESAVLHMWTSGPQPLHARYLIVLEAPGIQDTKTLSEASKELRTPGAVEALERTAHTAHPYLDYDDGFALARKCTWALAAERLGCPQALHR